MSKITFSDKDINILKTNPNIKRVSKLSITYSDNFKRICIEDYLSGKLPRQIFEENGFDINVLGMKRIEQSAARWKRAYEKDGIIGLIDTRRTQSGRPLERELSQEEIIQRQEAKIKLLEGQVELLKKADLIERGLVKASEKLPPNKIFKLISEAIKKNNLKNMTKYLCELLGISRSGYYSYLKAEDTRNEREKSDLKVKDIILKAFNRREYKKGSSSIKMILENEFDLQYSRKRIQRIMNKYNIICPHRKSNPYRRIAKATKEHNVVPNKLNREFKQGVPAKVLLTDITYLPYGNSNMAYLSTIKNGSTNEVLAYHVSDRITLDIATETIRKLIKNKKINLHERCLSI